MHKLHIASSFTVLSYRLSAWRHFLSLLTKFRPEALPGCHDRRNGHRFAVVRFSGSPDCYIIVNSSLQQSMNICAASFYLSLCGVGSFWFLSGTCTVDLFKTKRVLVQLHSKSRSRRSNMNQLSQGAQAHLFALPDPLDSVYDAATIVDMGFVWRWRSSSWTSLTPTCLPDHLKVPICNLQHRLMRQNLQLFRDSAIMFSPYLNELYLQRDIRVSFYFPLSSEYRSSYSSRWDLEDKFIRLYTW